jgi:hypothetical protein
MLDTELRPRRGHDAAVLHPLPPPTGPEGALRLVPEAGEAEPDTLCRTTSRTPPPTDSAVIRRGVFPARKAEAQTLPAPPPTDAMPRPG